MVGATITETVRYGKFLWLILDETDALLIRLWMNGQMLVTSSDAPTASNERARFTFTYGGHHLRFNDRRTFGHLMYDEGGAARLSSIARIARDLSDTLFDQALVVEGIHSKRIGIKRALLDQTVVSGI